MFLAATALLGAAGAAAAFFSRASALFAQGLRLLETFPGGVGDIFLPILYLGPWTFATILTCLPWLVVQRTRRRRVESMEQDLPVTLELLATLGEAGLGFDAALARLLDSQPYDRPLSRELRTFQLDTLSGRSRAECFRRLAARVDLPALSTFVSAIVQAERVGAAVAGVLRQQADDLRDRRRENAMALAMSLSVKRLFPMMICFLPGIFVATLGPTFFQFFQYAETILRLQTFGGAP
jgi:pilus assembly protein TadC